MLYVGRARDLRARLRSYFQTDRQRPAVEAALGAVERIEWRVLGSELEAALEELRLLRELRPAANARSTRPDRYVYLRRRGAGFVVSEQSTPLGPIKSRRLAQRAARALDGVPGGFEGDDLAAALPPLQGRSCVASPASSASRTLRGSATGSPRSSRWSRSWPSSERLRELRVCLLVPAADDRFRRAFFVSGGRVVAERTLLPGEAGRAELEAGLAAAARAEPSAAPEDLDELLLVGLALRTPPPELRAIPLDALAARAA